MNTSEAKKMNRIQNSPEINHKQTGQNKVHMKVTESGKITKGEKYIYIFFSLILVLFSAYIVFYSSQTDTMNRELQTYEATVEDQKLINEGLTFEVKELSQPERIKKIAKENDLKNKYNKKKQTYKTKVENQKLINEGLKFEVKKLSQPERITKIAKENGLKIQDNQVKKANLIEE